MTITVSPVPYVQSIRSRAVNDGHRSEDITNIGTSSKRTSQIGSGRCHEHRVVGHQGQNTDKIAANPFGHKFIDDSADWV
jgi:hypothetical protein